MPANLKAELTIYPEEKIGGPIPARLFGNFLEHLGYAVNGGILAHALANPTFERDANLRDEQKQSLIKAGRILTRYFQKGCDPQEIPEHWSPGIEATGFGVCALDDATGQNIPFPWSPLGGAGLVTPAVGRVGGAVRFHGIVERSETHTGDLIQLDDGPTGIRQGIFLPFQRCLEYHGNLILRIANTDNPPYDDSGKVEIGLRRRVRGLIHAKRVGECLALDVLKIQGSEWQTVNFHFAVAEGLVSTSEPVDFFIRWLPHNHTDLFIDRVALLPIDAVDGIFDPDVMREVKEWKVPLLRWPGGNFASYYHWRDGIGPLERRPTRPNHAWGGLETNFFGTVEFIHFCRLVGAEAHITVNTGTGTAEEAADWVAFCNDAPDSRMGRKRAAGGDAQPYGVRLWEVGNEVYGSWQGGYHGGDENVERFREFAMEMRNVDPHIELIATGNQFDIARPDPSLDHTTADRVWNKKVIEACAEDIDFLSLHCLPSNDLYLEELSPGQAYYSLMAQPVSWERIFLPQLKRLIDAAPRADSKREPVRLAITEWGVLGSRSNVHPVVENYGEAVYAGLFLNMCMRNHPLVPVANATGLLHGGCIRKAAGLVYHDPQYTVIQKYTDVTGMTVLKSDLSGPSYNTETAPDLGLPLEHVPLVDAVTCVNQETGGIIICVVNRHLTEPIELRFEIKGEPAPSMPGCTYLHDWDVTARARLGEGDRFRLQQGAVIRDGEGFVCELPPCSVCWIA